MWQDILRDRDFFSGGTPFVMLKIKIESLLLKITCHMYFMD
jgi:hypothetical protein